MQTEDKAANTEGRHVCSTGELGQAQRRAEFDEYAFLADFDTTRSTCGGRSGKYASEVTQRAYMVWADQQREIERLQAELLALTKDRDTWVRRADKTWHEGHAVSVERERCAKLVEDANAWRGGHGYPSLLSGKELAALIRKA